ncbi:MAG: hypothetical protein A2Y25_00905 [Candidatus Melainabacteria bacterium GWF2_37_15]|nr:MAG: hypothetical protein A2Y25_00905 [Candidatus Melainabacteria bacterium GWF2_37_15]
MTQCCKQKGKIDYLFWSTFGATMLAYALHVINPPVMEFIPALGEFSHSVYELVNKMWWGLLLGVIFVGLIGIIPRDVIINLLGRKKGITSIFRATVAGILLDLCSHGILLVSMKLYERGARLSQVVAFLVASPWNSLSLTVILIAFIGWKWTIAYIILSMLIAVASGLVAEFFVSKGMLPDNPHHYIEVDEFKGQKLIQRITPGLVITAFKESEMIMRWIFLGVIAAALIRVFVPTETFTTFFGPTLLGLGLTLVAATIIEVCSEGSVPIAYDLFSRAAAPGNAFLFLMGGASTDYTEIMALKETTRSWKIAFFLPFVTVPQILVISYILNNVQI